MVCSTAEMLTVKPSSSAVFAVMGPIAAQVKSFILVIPVFTAILKKFLAVEELVNVTRSIFVPAIASFADCNSSELTWTVRYTEISSTSSALFSRRRSLSSLGAISARGRRNDFPFTSFRLMSSSITAELMKRPGSRSGRMCVLSVYLRWPGL